MYTDLSSETLDNAQAAARLLFHHRRSLGLDAGAIKLDTLAADITAELETRSQPRAVPADRLFICPPDELEQALIACGRTLPGWTMAGTFLAPPTIRQYRAQLASAGVPGATARSLRHALSGAGGGYAVLRLGNVAAALGTGDEFLRAVTAVLAELAAPFQPFRRWPLWKEIGTSLEANPGLSTGTGYNALHMDLVNATRPPDYAVLLCIRPDPLGGGPSILSDARAAVSRLTPQSCALLARSAYSYGSFYDLANVGIEYKPFPVLDRESAGTGFVRFTAKMLSEPGLEKAHASAAGELAGQLTSGQLSYTLQRGDLLIINQHRYLHGREPLSDGQEDIDPAHRRLLLQLFLRSDGSGQDRYQMRPQ